jgi:hypothetical protein
MSIFGLEIERESLKSAEGHRFPRIPTDERRSIRRGALWRLRCSDSVASLVK